MSRAARATPIGSLRPSIVLYDEPHPLGDDIGGLQSYDLSRSPDMLLIMGTSLKVHGLKKLVKEFAKAVHAKKGLVVFVNATPPSKEWEGVIDYHVHGETDRWVEKVEEEWRKIKPQDWEVQTLLDGEMVPVAGGSVKGKSKRGLDLLPWRARLMLHRNRRGGDTISAAYAETVTIALKIIRLITRFTFDVHCFVFVESTTDTEAHRRFLNLLSIPARIRYHETKHAFITKQASCEYAHSSYGQWQSKPNQEDQVERCFVTTSHRSSQYAGAW